jgi:hypothetical protein
VAIEDQDEVLRGEAVVKLCDPGFLAKVALQGGDRSVRISAFRKFKNATNLAEISATAEPTTRLYASVLEKITRACTGIPSNHRDRLCGEVLGIVNLFLDPMVTKKLGTLKDIIIEWLATSQNYREEGVLVGKQFEENGEEITLMVDLSKDTLGHSWSTKFPVRQSISSSGPELGFREAPINPMDLAYQICGSFSLPDLEKIALESERPILRRVAVEKLSNPAILERIAAKDKDGDVRQKATERLCDLRSKK